MAGIIESSERVQEAQKVPFEIWKHAKNGENPGLFGNLSFFALRSGDNPEGLVEEPIQANLVLPEQFGRGGFLLGLPADDARAGEPDETGMGDGRRIGIRKFGKRFSPGSGTAGSRRG